MCSASAEVLSVSRLVVVPVRGPLDPFGRRVPRRLHGNHRVERIRVLAAVVELHVDLVAGVAKRTQLLHARGREDVRMRVHRPHAHHGAAAGQQVHLAREVAFQ